MDSAPYTILIRKCYWGRDGQCNQFLQHKDYFVPRSQHHDKNLVQIVRSTTPVASGILSDLVRLVESPHTPSPPVTSSGHSLSSTDSHPHVNSALHMRRIPLMVPPHSSRTLHPEIALMHHLEHMMFPHHISYPHHSDLRLPQDPSQHLHQSSIMDPKSEQKVIDDLSKVLQRKNHVPSAS
ncbi:protein split ends [Trichonephila clavipes]|nr:protein split ends [Trichonephila clavipes]